MKTKIKIPNTSFFEKLIEQSKSIYARTLLYFISFIEAIFFPIPVDPLLAILVLNNKQKYIELTIFCTLASVIGGLVGWLLGYVIGEEIEELLTIIPWIKNDSFNTVKKNFKNFILPIHNFKKSGFLLPDKISPKNIKSIGIVAFGRDHKAELTVKEINFTK